MKTESFWNKALWNYLFQLNAMDESEMTPRQIDHRAFLTSQL